MDRASQVLILADTTFPYSLLLTSCQMFESCSMSAGSLQPTRCKTSKSTLAEFASEKARLCEVYIPAMMQNSDICLDYKWVIL